MIKLKQIMGDEKLPTLQHLEGFFYKNDRKATICIDFDKTLCDSNYPDCGDEIESICKYIRYISKSFHSEVILWSCRCGDSLIEAIKWCNEHNIHIDEVNRQGYFNEMQFTESRKVYCDLLIDDCSYGFDIKDFELFVREHEL